MELAIYQILTPLLALVMIARVVSKFRRKERTIREVLVHLSFWIIIIAVSLVPDFFVQNIERWTGLKSGVNGILFFWILILSLLVIHLLHENQERSSEVTELVRHLAIKESKEEPTSSKDYEA